MVPLEGRAAHSPLLNCSSDMGLREEGTAIEIGRREGGRSAWAMLLPSLTFVAYVPVAGTSWFVVALLGAGTVAVILGLFLALSYYLRSLWRPGAGRDRTQRSGAAGDHS